MVMAGEVVVGLNARAGTFVREFSKATKAVTTWRTSARKSTVDTARVTSKINTLRINAVWLKPALNDITVAANRVRTSMLSAEKAVAKLQARKKALRAVSSGLLAGIGPLVVAYGALALAMKAINITRQAASFDVAAATFKRTGGSIDELREATGGLIDDAQLVRRANLAKIMKIPSDAFAKLAKVAKASSAATGQSFSFLLNSIITGTARQSRLILDNLGILINASDANKRYAETWKIVGRELTEAEKRQAFLDEVLRQGDKIIQAAGGSAESLTDAYEAANAATANLSTTIGQVLQPTMQAMTKSGTASVIMLDNFLKKIRDIVIEAPTAVDGLEDVMKALFQTDAKPRDTKAFKAIDAVALRFELLGKARAKLARLQKKQANIRGSKLSETDATNMFGTDRAGVEKEIFAVELGIADLQEQIDATKGKALAMGGALGDAGKEGEKGTEKTKKGVKKLKKEVASTINFLKELEKAARAALGIEVDPIRVERTLLVDADSFEKQIEANARDVSSFEFEPTKVSRQITVEEFEENLRKEREPQREEAQKRQGEVLAHGFMAAARGDVATLGAPLGASIGGSIGKSLAGGVGAAAGGAIGGAIGGELINAAIELAKMIGETFVKGIQDMAGAVKKGVIDPVVGTSSGAGSVVASVTGAAKTAGQFAGGAVAVGATAPLIAAFGALVVVLGLLNAVVQTVLFNLNLIPNTIVAIVLTALAPITLAATVLTGAFLVLIGVISGGLGVTAAMLALGKDSDQAKRFGDVLGVAADIVQSTAGNIFTSLLPIAGLFVLLAKAIAPIINRFTGVDQALPFLFNAIKVVAVGILFVGGQLALGFETIVSAGAFFAIGLDSMSIAALAVQKDMLFFSRGIAAATGASASQLDVFDDAISDATDAQRDAGDRIEQTQQALTDIGTTADLFGDAIDAIIDLDPNDGLDAANDSIEDMGDEVDNATSNFQAMNESLSRVPRGVRVALQRFEASRAQGSVAEFGSVNAAGPIAGGIINIIIGEINQDEDPELVLNRVISGTQRRLTDASGNPNVAAIDSNGF